ncbi:MAG TPA: glycosyltransferase [Actinomycetota bacterium]|nr:glycosyltransferase [Actinomycetota bacterium]
MIATIVLTTALVLALAAVLLLAIGRHARFSSRLFAIPLAAAISYGGAELALRFWSLVPSYALTGAGVAFLGTVCVILALPYWNPLGQVFLGAFASAACAYLGLALYLTLAGDLPLVAMIASGVLFVFEFLALLLAGYFAFEGCDVLCRTRATRDLPVSDPAHTPKVSLQVAASNEPPDMLIDTIKSLESIDYSNLEVVVIDNNTADEEMWRPVADYCEGRDKVRFLHLEGIEGFKAGALNHAIPKLDPDVEIVGIIDADYLADADYLRRTVGYFANPNVAFVQTPQDYREYEGDPYLTACYDGYKYFFKSSMPSRNQRNSIIFSGTMGLIRRSSLEEIGGWPEWCITEDAETSLRLLQAGSESVYIDQSMGRGIMPLTFSAFKRQRYRWCFGGIQILRRYFRTLLPWPRTRRNRLTLGQRLDYLFGSGLVWFNDVLHLAFTLALLVAAYLILSGEEVNVRPLFGSLVVLPVALIATGILRAQWTLRHTTGIGITRAVLAFLNWLSTSWTVAIATLQALIRPRSTFMRTPKQQEDQSMWGAIRDAKVETVLTLVLWGLGIAVALSGEATPLLVGLFAWQGVVYGSSLLMSWLNVRVKLTPQLERRRRTEHLRERAAALVPYYVGASAALLAFGIVGAVLVMGGSQSTRPPRDVTDIPRSSEESTLARFIIERREDRPEEPGSPQPEESEQDSGSTPSENEAPQDEVTPQESPTEEETATPEASPPPSPESSP